MRIIQFIIPWSTLISTSFAQLSQSTANFKIPQTYPIDPTFYNQFLINQAQLNQALLVQNNMLQQNVRLPVQQVFPHFSKQNLELPSQSFFDPLAIPSITDIQVHDVISPTLFLPHHSQTESYLGGIPSSSTHSKALTDKSDSVSTIPSETSAEDLEEVRLIRKLVEETLADERRERSTAPVSTQGEEKVPFRVLDTLNLDESEKNAIVARVEELLSAEITRKLLSDASPRTHASSPLSSSPSPTTNSVSSTSTVPSTTTVHPSTTEFSATPPSTTSPQIMEVLLSTTIESQRTTTRPELINEKNKLKSLATKQTKSTQVGGRSIVRSAPFSESIELPVSRLKVSSMQKEIRESQPALPTRYAHHTNKDLDEDLDLIDRSDKTERNPDTAAVASLLTAARRIAYPQNYEEITVGSGGIEDQEEKDHHKDFFHPVTGSPLDLSDVYEDEEEEVPVGIDQRRTEQFSEIATPSPFSLRTTGRPFHEETSTTSSSRPSDPVNLDTVTTPPFRNGRLPQPRATKFEVLASDYRSRLGEAGDLGLILKKLSQNAYIALIESDGDKSRIRHESRRKVGRL